MKKRSERKISFIVVAILCVISLKSEAQRPVFKKDGIIPEKYEWERRDLMDRKIFSNDPKSFVTYARLIPAPLYTNSRQKPVPADFYVKNFGFFCKKEWEFEKTVHIPLRFRLGSLEYCNYLEGKNN